MVSNSKYDKYSLPEDLNSVLTPELIEDSGKKSIEHADDYQEQLIQI